MTEERIDIARLIQVVNTDTEKFEVTFDTDSGETRTVKMVDMVKDVYPDATKVTYSIPAGETEYSFNITRDDFTFTITLTELTSMFINGFGREAVLANEDI